MFDMTKLLTRYFDVKLKGGTIISVEPPKLKVLKKISKLSSVNDKLKEEDIDNIIVALSLALSKNKQRINISKEKIEDTFNIDEMIQLLTEYFDWVNEVQDSKN